MESLETSNKDTLVSDKKKDNANKYMIIIILLLILMIGGFGGCFYHIRKISLLSKGKEVILAINGETIKEVYTKERAIEDCKKAFKIIAENSYKCPVRSFLNTKHQDLTIMPASVLDTNSEQLSVKILSIVPNNRKRGLPLIPGKLLLFNEETGFLKSFMDGGMVTNLRTGATAGATAQVLHPNPVYNVVVFGCGAQGNYGIESLITAHPEIKKVTCIDYFPEVAVKLAKTRNALNDGIKYYANGDVESAVREADVIHCATTSKKELFDGNWVKDGAHISAIGCYTLEMRELPTNIFKRSNVKLYVDQFDAMKEEAGDIMAAVNSKVLNESNIKLFGDVINKNDKGRTDDKQITICKFVGVAPQDTVAANSIYELAVQKGKGVKIGF